MSDQPTPQSQPENPAVGSMIDPESLSAGLDESDHFDEAPAEELDPDTENVNANALAPQDDFDILPVVGIGGSAGSIAVLQRLFSNLPGDTGMAFVVVTHLAPDFDSHLTEILARTTPMPVVMVEAEMKLQANHVYVIPPGHHLAMQGGNITLSPMENDFGKRVAVDLFFRTLAASHRSRSVAIVLSGLDSDGAIGIKRIKEHGGVTIAQDPDEAQHDGMPRAAIQTGMVDWILPVAEMAPRLERFIKNELNIVFPSAEVPAVAAEPQNGPRQPSGVDEAALRDILSFLLARTGHDFSHYKRATVLRRIGRRLQVNTLTSFADYLAFLRTHPGESGALLQDLLISVTNFFRDPEAFEALRLQIPALFKDKKEDDVVRVWVAGCATGEEAYSVAMMLIEHADTLLSPPAMQIFATDIDEEATAVAREGRYPQAIVADVSPERLRRFFTLDQGLYRVRKDLREIVLFASHDLLRDSPFSRLDLITCRNVLIYFNNDAQQKIFGLFHFALRPHGRLFLGGSESADDTKGLFGSLDKKHRIYHHKLATRAPLVMPAALPLAPTTSLSAPAVSKFATFSPPVLPSTLPSPRDGAAAFTELHLLLLEQHAPPSVLVNSDYDILHLSQHAGRFLRFGGGKVSTNLMDVVVPELRLELRSALFRAIQERQSVDVPGLATEIGDRVQTVDLRVRPFFDTKVADSPVNYLLVIFATREVEGESQIVGQREEDALNHRLELELLHLKDHLRATVDQYEAATEELKASNEELQAMNEEMRSASEELETSREELQATNEELITVNHEMKSRVEELARANSDLQNLMASTNIATIFLDRSLHIKRYTLPAVELFNLVATDEGRPLSLFRHRLEYEELASDAEQVLKTLAPIEREVPSNDGRWFLARVQPYRTIEDLISGVVVTFFDITERKRAGDEMRQSRARLELIVESASDYAIVTQDTGGIITGWNSGAENILDWTRDEAVGQHVAIFFTAEDNVNGAPQQEMETARNEGRAADERWHVRKDGSRLFMSGVLTPMYESEELSGYVKVARDLTREQTAENAVRESEARFRTLSDAVPQIIWTNDASGIANYFNSRWFEYSGLTLEESAGRGWQAIVHPDDAPASKEAWQNALIRGEVLDTEYCLRRSDGIYRWFIGRNVPLKDQGGQILGWFGTATDIQEIKEAQEGLRQSHELLEARVQERTLSLQEEVAERKRLELHRSELMQRIVQVQEEERGRISRELHDNLGQHATAIMLSLQLLQNADSQSAAGERRQSGAYLARLHEQMNDLLTMTHRLAWELRPAVLDNVGLDAALQQYLKEWERHGIEADFVSRLPVGKAGRTDSGISSDAETALYRVVQESLTNVLRHANASHVSVVLERGPQFVTVIVEDDGSGFDLSAASIQSRLGLRGMRERMELVGGTLEVESSPGEGTSVYARAPLNASSS